MSEDPGQTASGPAMARYEVIRKAGQGATGDVFRARDLQLDREVALKLFRLHEEGTSWAHYLRFEREAKLLAQHPHEAVVPVYDVDLGADPPYLVLRWMPGGDLTHFFRLSGPSAAEEVARIGERLAGALHHLHSHEILHRDVKPANVLLDEDGEVYLADLGLAEAPDLQDLTATGYVVGTPRYMSPELLAHGTYSPRSDLFALGVVLLELALGRRLDGVAGTDSRQVQEALRKVPSKDLRRVLRAILRSDPGDRPETAAALAAMLRPLIAPTEERKEATAPRPGNDSTLTVEMDPAVPVSTGPLSGPVTETLTLRRAPPLALLGGLLVVALFLTWFRPVTPLTLPPADPAEGRRERDQLTAARDQLHRVCDKLWKRRGYFRTHGLNADQDTPEILAKDAAIFTDATVGLLWNRYLKAVGEYLDAYAAAPPGTLSTRDAVRDVGSVIVGRGANFMGGIRKFVVRARNMILRGRGELGRVTTWLGLAERRIKEIDESTARWIEERKARNQEVDLGLVAFELRVRMSYQDRGFAEKFRKYFPVLAKARDDPLLPAVQNAVLDMLRQENEKALMGMAEFSCEELGTIHARMDDYLGSISRRERLEQLDVLFRNTWRCARREPGELGDLAVALIAEFSEELKGRPKTRFPEQHLETLGVWERAFGDRLGAAALRARLESFR